MNTERKSLAFGGGFGAMIAGILGLAITRQYELELWTIAPVALFGGCLGWLLCDIAGVKCAWRQAVEWKPDMVWWGEHLFFGFAISMFACSVVFWVLYLPSLSSLLPLPIGFSAACIVAAGTAVLIFSLGMLATCSRSITEDESHVAKVLLAQWNVVVFLISVGYYVTEGIIWFLPKTPFILKTVGKFLWHVFKLAHSERRRVCFIATAIATAIGYLYAYTNHLNLVSEAVSFGVLGAVIAPVWYEVVAIRWLGIQPA